MQQLDVASTVQLDCTVLVRVQYEPPPGTSTDGSGIYSTYYSTVQYLYEYCFIGVDSTRGRGTTNYGTVASWRGYANMLLGRIQYVGKAYAFNKVQRQYRLVEHLDQGAFGSWSCAHLMDRPLPDLHPSGWAY